MRAIRAVCVTRLVCALSASAVMTPGCTSMRPTPVVAATSQPSPSRVRPGDEVRLTMRDGRRAQFRVQTVDTASITALDGARYDLGDVLRVERREFSWVKTTVLLVGIGCFLFITVAAAGSLGGLSGFQ